MSGQRRGRAAQSSPEPEAAARVEPDGHGGATVWVSGQPQSHVQLDDPGLLVFEYVQHLGLIVDVLAEDVPPERGLRVTHIGGAGMTLPRYVEHVRPGSPQIVLEPAAAVTEVVRRELPLPRGHRIRVRPAGGRIGVAGMAAGSADLVVLDAFAAGSVPAELTTSEFVRDVARVLRPGGVLAMNIPDEPGRAYLARVVATLVAAAAYEQVVVIGTHDVLKGRRFGNYVVAAGDLPLATVSRAVARCPAPSGLWTDEHARRLARAARPLTDADAQGSPAPPDPGRWRAR